MKKYKLLKDYPTSKKGNIIESDGLGWYINNKLAIPKEMIENELDWFAPYIFTTEDGVDIYVGDMYWWFISNNYLDNQLCTTRSGRVDGYKYFSTKEKAQEYLKSKETPEWVICIKEKKYLRGKLNMLYRVESYNEAVKAYRIDSQTSIHSELVRPATEAEISAHEEGFHIGDKVWYAGYSLDIPFKEYLGKIKSFYYSLESPVLSCEVENKTMFTQWNLRDLTKKEPMSHKFITEEGTKIYKGDKCWYINNDTTSIIKETSYEVWVGGSSNGKYFSGEEKARQYFAELQAEKRDIKIGTELFYDKEYRGNVEKIVLGDEDILLYLNHKPSEFLFLNDAVTLVELAKEEGLEVGMKIDKKLLKNYSISVGNNSRVDRLYVQDTIAYFSDGGFRHKIIGFKKFKEEWELTQKGITIVQGSDLDIDKTCETCKWVFGSHYCIDCKQWELDREDLWQPKEPKFEVNKWYEHETGSFGLFVENGCNNKGFDLLENDSYKWITNMKMTNPTEWKLADEKIKHLLLMEAKEKYPEGTEFYNLSGLKHRVETHSNITVEVGLNHTLIGYGGNMLFEDGKWAKIVTELRLMLGKEEVFITSPLDRSTGADNEKEVWTRQGSVTIEEWKKWYERLIAGLKLELSSFDLTLGTYPTHYHITNIELGCIKNVELSQIEEITQTIRNL